jgi:DNA-directed RNA polymerase II subunit RPB1
LLYQKVNKDKDDKKGEFDDIFRYGLDDENWRPAYILPKYVDPSKTIREFINVF